MNTNIVDDSELPDKKYLIDLSDRLMNVASESVSQWDCDRFLMLAENIERLELELEAQLKWRRDNDND